MTTMTTEQTLPQATLRRSLGTGLARDAVYPLLRTTGEQGPAGYHGCLIIPRDVEGDPWVITRDHPAVLRPYIGMRGWWVRADEVDIDETQTIAVTADVPDVPGLEQVPVEHRGAVPDGAYWVRLTRAVDGTRRGEEYLAIDAPDGRESRGPIIMAWPGHPRHSLFGNRPGIPDGWRGYWAHGDAERIEGMATSAEPQVGDRVRVITDRDQPSANGRFATLLEVRPEAGSSMRWRVRYEPGQEGVSEAQTASYGWWVEAVEPVVDEPYPVGHWFSWGTRTTWYEVVSFDGTSVTISRSGSEHGVRVRTGHREPDRRREGNFIVLPPGHADLPRPVREAAPVVPEPTSGFREGARVMLVSRHVMHPTDTGRYTEAPHGPGYSTAVLIERSGSSEGAWRLRWDGTGNTSVAHECCLAVIDEEHTLVEGDEIILVSDHVLQPGGHVYRESPIGIGSRGRITNVNLYGDRDHVSVQWVSEDGTNARSSTAHRSCLRLVPNVPVEAQPVSPDVPPMVPEGAHRVSHRGGGTIPAGEYMAVPRPQTERAWTLIAWPGHPQHSLMREPGHGHREEVPAGWASWRCTQAENTDLGPWEQVTEEPVAEVPVPEGALRVRYIGTSSSRAVVRNTEYMALRQPRGYTLLFWPEHEGYRHLRRTGRDGVPDDWRSYLANTENCVVIGPWSEPESTAHIAGVPDEYAGQVPEGAVWIDVLRSTGLPSGRYLAIVSPGEERNRTVLLWPGHPQYEEGFASRAGVPAGWRGYRTGHRGWSNEEPVRPVEVPVEAGDVEGLRAQLADVQRQYAEDMQRIAEIMKSEAERRDWCSEYEEVARRINAATHATFDGERDSEYSLTYTVSVPTTHTFSFTARPRMNREEIEAEVRSRQSIPEGATVTFETWIEDDDR